MAAQVEDREILRQVHNQLAYYRDTQKPLSPNLCEEIVNKIAAHLYPARRTERDL